MSKCYSELIQLPTFKERYDYLQIKGQVGESTFGFDRYLNQIFYKSPEWKRVRDYVIARDNGCDLGIEDRPIYGRILIHHMNPITQRDIYRRQDEILDPEFLIAVSHVTHNAIHYGDESMLFIDLVERTANDTCPWR